MREVVFLLEAVWLLHRTRRFSFRRRTTQGGGSKGIRTSRSRFIRCSLHLGEPELRLLAQSLRRVGCSLQSNLCRVVSSPASVRMSFCFFFALRHFPRFDVYSLFLCRKSHCLPSTVSNWSVAFSCPRGYFGGIRGAGRVCVCVLGLEISSFSVFYSLSLLT